jgi:hypothetical protein
MNQNAFRTARNTLEAKQFFRSEKGVLEFVKDATNQSYKPPYKHIFIIHMNKDCFENLNYIVQELDRFEAITVYEDDLPAFNNCVIFIDEIDTRNNI